MSIFDFDDLRINIPTKTLGGEVFWELIDWAGGYTLQRNKITGHFRILDSDNVRVAWSEKEGSIRAKFQSLSNPNIEPKRGDVIGVHRKGGIYDHYGIYESDNCVYEYAAPAGDFSVRQIAVRKTTLEKFIGDSNNCFILTFPEKYGKPGQVPVSMMKGGTMVAGSMMPGVNLLAIGALLEEFRKMKNYKLYSADETIERAQKRMGEASYNIVLNNCEHYAIWCKTGISESHQVNNLLRLVGGYRVSKKS